MGPDPLRRPGPRSRAGQRSSTVDIVSTSKPLTAREASARSAVDDGFRATERRPAEHRRQANPSTSVAASNVRQPSRAALNKYSARPAPPGNAVTQDLTFPSARWNADRTARPCQTRPDCDTTDIRAGRDRTWKTPNHSNPSIPLRAHGFAVPALRPCWCPGLPLLHEYGSASGVPTPSGRTDSFLLFPTHSRAAPS